MEGNLDVLVVLGIVAVCMVVGLWNNWIFIGPDGYNLTGNDRPSLFRFYAILLRHPIQAVNGKIFWPWGVQPPSCTCGHRRR
jgi:hypothetical protein